MNTTVHLFDLNMEGDKHLARIRPLLKERRPDVVCLQEIFADTAETLAKELQAEMVYVPLVRNSAPNDFFPRVGNLGVAIFSRYPIKAAKILPYVGSLKEIPTYILNNPHSFLRAVIVAEIQIEDQIYRVSTTHFTWSPGGSVTERQHHDLRSLLSVLEPYRADLVLCGDFNAPRGKAIFDTLATTFIDHIPPEVTTTVDQQLHRVKGLQFVIDGMFSSKNYAMTNVEVLSGLSDHCGIWAEIHKKAA